ncbi:putative membrane protein, partial [Acinetobacter baumannii 45002_8]
MQLLSFIIFIYIFVLNAPFFYHLPIEFTIN